MIYVVFLLLSIQQPSTAEVLPADEESSSDIIMDDLTELVEAASSTSSLEAEVAALKSKVTELEAKLQQKELEITRLQESFSAESKPHPFSVGKSCPLHRCL